MLSPQFNIKRKGKDFWKVYGFGLLISFMVCIFFLSTVFFYLIKNLNSADWIHNDSWLDKAILLRYSAICYIVGYFVIFIIGFVLLVFEFCVKGNDDAEYLEKEVELLKKNIKSLKEEKDELAFIIIKERKERDKKNED